MRGKWMARIWRARNTGEVSKFFMPTEKPEKDESRKETGRGSSRKKKDANGSQAVRRLARLLNVNFHPGDCLLTLHFDAAGLARVLGDHDTAEHQMMLFLRRMQYAYRKRGVTFRYVGMTSEKDDETLESARLHCHCVVSGDLISKPEGCGEYLLSGKPLSEVWGYGTVDVQLLRHQDDYTALAVYLCRQARCLPDEKRWHPSRNLLKPDCVDVELTTAAIQDYNRHKRKEMPTLKLGPDGRLLIPVRCTCLDDGEYIPAIGTHYVRFLMPEARRLTPPVPEYERRGGRRRQA